MIVILRFASVNETLWCYHLNDPSLVELLRGAIYFSLGISLKRNLESLWVFLSTLRSEMRSSTLPILFYVNVGVAENWFVIKNNAATCGSEIHQKLVLSTESTQVNWTPWRGFKACLLRATPSLGVFAIQHFLLRPIWNRIQSTLHVWPPRVSYHLSKTPHVTQLKPYSWNFL